MRTKQSRAKYNGTLPLVKDCLAKMQESGVWKLQYYNAPWYVFRNNDKPFPEGQEHAFTLAELRHAAYFGW